jgi:hypothetical protein
MKAGIYWRDEQNLFDIVNESKGNYPVLTATDFELSYQPDLQIESFKNLIQEHFEEFAPVFNSTDGRTTFYEIKSAAVRP